MESKDAIPQENPAMARIFEMMEALLLEIQIDGNYIRVPRELRPSKKEVSANESNRAVLSSLNSVCEQLLFLTDWLAMIDPEFFDARLKIFLDEWPKRHSDKNPFFFWTLKFYIEAHVEMILIKSGRE